MHLRIQTYGTFCQITHFISSADDYIDKVNVQDILEKGLDDLSDLCDVVIEKFETAREDYHKKNPP